MIKLTPNQLQSILNATLFEIRRYPKQYTKTLPKVKEILIWLQSIQWEEPNEDSIMIDELPF